MKILAKTSNAKPQSTKQKIQIDTEQPEDERASDIANGNIGDELTEDAVDTEVNSNPIEILQEELAQERDKYLRLAAEYDNFRKRSAKEREVIYRDARIDAITKLLPVYDNLERALKMECSDEPYYKGVEMIMLQLTEVLEDMGVKQIPAVGEQFDPNLHNAVLKIEDPELSENTIAEECQKGFIIGDRVIRFSTVVVAN